MRMDKLTAKFQLALGEAQSLALGRDHQFIEPAHLLIALLDQEGGGVRPLLAQADDNVNALRSELGRAVDALPTVHGTGGDVQVSNDLGRLLNLTDLRYLGCVEGRSVPLGEADVVVTDGFVGNVVLKLSEGIATLAAAAEGPEIAAGASAESQAIVFRQVFR